MLLQVHDELVFETDADELETIAALATDVMEGALPLDVPLTVDLKVGSNWEEMDRLERSPSGGWLRSGSAAPEPESDAEAALSDALSA
jgi:hypothetical protein